MQDRSFIFWCLIH